jgi:hypothetical protein
MAARSQPMGPKRQKKNPPDAGKVQNLISVSNGFRGNKKLSRSAFFDEKSIPFHERRSS